jgi:hypothetical protein
VQALDREGRFYVQLNHVVTLRTGLGLSRVIILQGTHMDLQRNICPQALVPSQTVSMSTTRFASEEARVPESRLHGSFNDECGSSSEGGPILAFIVLANAVTWLACLLAFDVRSRASVGTLYIRVRHGMVAYCDCIGLVLLF